MSDGKQFQIIKENENYSISTTYPYIIRCNNSSKYEKRQFMSKGKIYVSLNVKNYTRLYKMKRIIFNNLISDIPRNYYVVCINGDESDLRLENLKIESRSDFTIKSKQTNINNPEKLTQYNENIFVDIENKKYYHKLSDFTYRELIPRVTKKYECIRYTDNEGNDHTIGIRKINKALGIELKPIIKIKENVIILDNPEKFMQYNKYIYVDPENKKYYRKIDNNKFYELKPWKKSKYSESIEYRDSNGKRHSLTIMKINKKLGI